jgi:2-hydroxychromene-2-carboxylate isomerase
VERTLDFWFDYSCPYAYLGFTQVEAFAKRLGARLTLEPMLLGGVFRANGTPQNLMRALSTAKAAHNAADMQRWADLFGATLHVPPTHPMRTVEALRATLVTGIDIRVVAGFYRAYWVEGRAISEEATLRDVLTRAGHDAGAVLARIDDAAVKDDLRARTERAIVLGIFGAPSFLVSVASGKELFWGQDRMELIERLAFPSAFSHPPRAPERAPTMSHTLDVYWDFSSPFSYLGATQVEALAGRTGAAVTWKPMLLGGLFRKVGQVDVPFAAMSPAKQRHTMLDMERWAAHWGVPFKFPSTFPVNSVKALRAYLALPEERRGSFREATFRAYWAEDRDIARDDVLEGLLGPGAADILKATQTPAIKQALIEATDAAANAGVFGAPTFVVDGKELFWGQDRLSLVERALRA